MHPASGGGGGHSHHAVCVLPDSAALVSVCQVLFHSVIFIIFWIIYVIVFYVLNIQKQTDQID